MKGSRSSGSRAPASDRTRSESIRLDAVGIGVLVGAAVAFFYIDAIVDVLWIIAGGVIGGAAGYGVKYLVHEARRKKRALDLRDGSKEELYAKAQEMDIPGRSQMTTDELASAITEHETAS